MKFYHCGEYGEKNRRPHYHACLFGIDFEDKTLFKQKRGNDLYISDHLQELWPFGFSTIGEVTFESAAYCARYIMKKITGDGAEEHYQWIDTETGEVHQLKPEYTTMSRNGGIGKEWMEKFKSDVYPTDEIIIRGRRMKPPRFYDSMYEHTDPEGWAKVSAKRKRTARSRAHDNTPERLKARERVQKARLKLLPRNLDEDEDEVGT